MTDASTKDRPEAEKVSRVAWRDAGLRYHAYRFFLRNRFGGRVQRVSLDARMTCPNVDGTASVGGCVFCNNRSFSPSRRLPPGDILHQLDEGIRRLRGRYHCNQFLAYFQPGTNTYAPVEVLRPWYEQALLHPQVVAMAIGTRADCVPDDVLDLLSEFAGRTHLSVEFGLQTVHDRSLAWMNRGHDYGAFLDAVARSRGRRFQIGAHVILGLPDESREDMLTTARELARLELDSVKIHHLYAVRGTPLVQQVCRGEVRLMERDEFVETVIDFLELLPPGMIIERIGGDAPSEFLVGPAWSLDKPGLLAAVQSALERRDTWQGRLSDAGHETPCPTAPTKVSTRQEFFVNHGGGAQE
jgi:uncharacterized protein